MLYNKRNAPATPIHPAKRPHPRMKKLLPLILMLLAGLATACVTPQVSTIDNGPTPAPQDTTPQGILQTLPADLPRPAPLARTFEGCPAQGDGGDSELNQLKNRVD